MTSPAKTLSIRSRAADMDHADSPQAIASSRWSFGDLTNRSWFWPIFALALIFMVDGVVSPGFFSIRIVQGRLFGSLIDVLYRGTPTALVALGMAVVIGTKGIDLSVGAVVAVLDIQPIIATLILMVAGRGIALLIDEGLIVTFRSDFFSAISTGEFLTVPSRIIVCAGTLLFLWLILRRTALGLFIESVGGNSAAADLAGINARLVKIGAYTLSGLCSGIAGVLICADIRGSDSNNAGLFIELDAILAVVIGGGSLAGGRFYLGLTIVGVLVIQGLTTSILVSGLPAQFNMIVKGVVVLIVLLLGSRRLRQSIVGLFRRRTS